MGRYVTAARIFDNVHDAVSWCVLWNISISTRWTYKRRWELDNGVRIPNVEYRRLFGYSVDPDDVKD